MGAWPRQRLDGQHLARAAQRLTPWGKWVGAAQGTIADVHYLVPCNPNCPALDKCLRDERLSELQGTGDWRDYWHLYLECLDAVSLEPDPAFLPTQPAW